LRINLFVNNLQKDMLIGMHWLLVQA